MYGELFVALDLVGLTQTRLKYFGHSSTDLVRYTQYINGM